MSTFVVVFVLWALNMIAVELENPFGDDPNDIDCGALHDQMNAFLLQLISAPQWKTPTLVEGAEMLGQASNKSNVSWDDGMRCMPTVMVPERLKNRATFFDMWIHHDDDDSVSGESVIQCVTQEMSNMNDQPSGRSLREPGKKVSQITLSMRRNSRSLRKLSNALDTFPLSFTRDQMLAEASSKSQPVQPLRVVSAGLHKTSGRRPPAALAAASLASAGRPDASDDLEMSHRMTRKTLSEPFTATVSAYKSYEVAAPEQSFELHPIEVDVQRSHSTPTHHRR